MNKRIPDPYAELVGTISAYVDVVPAEEAIKKIKEAIKEFDRKRDAR